MPGVDNRPQFTFQEKDGKISAEVRLPNCLTIRVANSRKSWVTERAAKKDAAFQAYKALFNAGLLNENLLPLSHEWNKEQQEQIEGLPAMLNVAAQFNPLRQLAQSWTDPDIHLTSLIIRRKVNGNVGEVKMTITTPQAIISQPISQFELYWDAQTLFTVDIHESRHIIDVAPLSTLRKTTHLLYRSTHGDRLSDHAMDYVMLFTPELAKQDLNSWLDTATVTSNALNLFKNGVIPHGLVRPGIHYGAPSEFYQWQTADNGAVSIECRPLFKRRNFLSPQTLSSSDTREVEIFLAGDCIVDSLPYDYVQVSLLIPAITRHIEAKMVAEQVCKNILTGIPIKNMNNIVTAITAPSAGWITDYDRFEFLGDSILKFITSIQLYVDHPNWPEGYLSVKQSVLVSNANLAKVALEKGLDSFIMTLCEKERKWRPLLVSDNSGPTSRELSMKVVADVVEGLIGACYMELGFQGAFGCINRFIPEIRATKPILTKHDTSPELNFFETLKAEEVICYSFNNKALLVEALTHPSCSTDLGTQSYQRLEFLGDAILDMIMALYLIEHKPELTPKQMTQAKSCLVNSDLLGFICLDFRVARDEGFQISANSGVYTANPITGFVQLWKYMRHQSQPVIGRQVVCSKRFQEHREGILNELKGPRYPWAKLAKFHPDKFYCDIIESIIGAIYIDSGGDLEPCRCFLERIGLTRHMRHILEDEVDVSHPKNALQESLGSTKVEYIVEAGDEPGLRTCKVFINQKEVTEIRGYLNNDPAITVAADSALNILGGRLAENPHA
jgi:dsRNA-specific ribonuclease